MKEASFYRPNDAEATVHCCLCAHNCKITEGRRGLCRVRENRNGRLYSLVYGKVISENADPIEKKPLFHVLPGSFSFSIATVGCNFRCQHCQNFEISQYPSRHKGEIPGRNRSAEQIVEAALADGCESISYTYVEPTIFYEFAYDTAVLAQKNNLRNIFVSNGYTGEEATRQFAPHLDANNIDLKAFTDSFYREVCGARLQPVLDTIVLMKKLGVWVEVTTLLIPGLNDSDDELRDIAAFIASVDQAMPWHVTRFHPTYKMTNRPPTPVETIRRARDIGLTAGLRHVYTGNVYGEEGESTFCPACGAQLIERTGFSSRTAHFKDGACTGCGEKIAGIWK